MATLATLSGQAAAERAVSPPLAATTSPPLPPPRRHTGAAAAPERRPTGSAAGAPAVPPARRCPVFCRLRHPATALAAPAVSARAPLPAPPRRWLAAPSPAVPRRPRTTPPARGWQTSQVPRDTSAGPRAVAATDVAAATGRAALTGRRSSIGHASRSPAQPRRARSRTRHVAHHCPSSAGDRARNSSDVPGGRILCPRAFAYPPAWCRQRASWRRVVIVASMRVPS